MSAFVVSNNHINALVLAMVNENLIDKAAALDTMRDMKNMNTSYVRALYAFRSRDVYFVIPQSLDDNDHPFTLDLDIQHLSARDLSSMAVCFMQQSGYISDEESDPSGIFTPLKQFFSKIQNEIHASSEKHIPAVYHLSNGALQGMTPLVTMKAF